MLGSGNVVSLAPTCTREEDWVNEADTSMSGAKGAEGIGALWRHDVGGKPCLKRVIGRPSYITSQVGRPFGYWFMGHDHLPHERGNVGSHDEHDGCHRQADPAEPDTHE